MIETGNRIIETGNEINSFTYSLLMKKTHLTKYFPFNPKCPNQLQKQEIELLKQEMELFFLLTDF